MQFPNDLQTRIEQRLRTMRTLWIALLMAVVMYYVFTLISGRSENATPNNTLSLALIVAGFMVIPVSFVIKKKLLNQAVEQQQVGAVQQAYIVAWAMSEVPALLGLVDFFVTGNPYYFVPMIVAACAQLLHYPQRQHVIDASYKAPAELQI